MTKCGVEKLKKIVPIQIKGSDWDQNLHFYEFHTIFLNGEALENSVANCQTIQPQPS